MKGVTDDGYIIWGQKFRGVITAGANYEGPGLMLNTGTVTKMIDATGVMDRGDRSYYTVPCMRQTHDGFRFCCSFLYGIGQTYVTLLSMSELARNNAPYEVFLDYTDGTRV